MVPDLSESVSLGKDGKLHMTLTNASLTDSAAVEGIIVDTAIKSVKGRVLTDQMRAHNTFENPDAVHTEEFTGVAAEGGRLCFTVPACSVLHLEVEI